MLELIFKVLGAGLSIWESKEKTKYSDQLLELKRAYYEEYNKPIAARSDAVLDNIERELRLLCEAFTASVGAKNPSPKS